MGIVTSPIHPADDQRPAVVFINSGIVHRVGVNRLHVILARSLATFGYSSLRFDLSGIGDSQREEEVMSLAHSVAKDLDQALDHLREARKKERFILLGLCSGAHDAFLTGLRRPDVVGLCLLDLPGPFRNWQHVFHHYRRRVFRWKSWRNILWRRRINEPRALPLHLSSEEREGADVAADVRRDLSKPEMLEGFQELLSRSVSIQLVFTSGVESHYNHGSQFREVFPSLAAHPLLSYQYFPSAYHVFERLGERHALLQLVQRWLASDFGAPPATHPVAAAETGNS
jgi:pimeloyl-ACP methyl ester carboxylesterase